MKPTAIVCDDESHIRSMLKLVLKTMGVEVVGEARNADEAESFFRTKKPHLVLLDINMPGRSGEEALENILKESPSAFVIMLTSVVDLETVNRCLDKGAANYILKETPVPDMKRIIKETWDELRKSRETGNV